MGAIQKLPLSGSSQGNPIQIVATASPGTTIHTTGSSSTIIDEVWLYAANIDTANRTLTVEYGATASSNIVEVVIPAKSGLSIVLPGSIITGNGSVGATISAFASTTNVINVLGYINRITP